MPKALVTLYHTAGCHLCDEALVLLQQVFSHNEIACLDIVDNEHLLEQYQTSIPVVEFFNGVKLFWPFTHEQIKQNS